MKEKALEALEQVHQATSNIRDSFTLNDWKNEAENVIIRIYGKDSPQVSQLNTIRHTAISKIETSIASSKKLIQGLIRDVERFGLPVIEPSSDGIHINITQNQNQETKVNLQFFIEAIRDELTGSQQKEIQQIIDETETDASTKKSRIIDKLKSFGGDVASNIVANILTNPGLYGG